MERPNWRAVVSLLPGHRSHPTAWSPATGASDRLLQLTGPRGWRGRHIAALAEQGLQRFRSEHIASQTGATRATDGAIPDLLKDPFLSTDNDQAKPAPADLVTAMPWLSGDDEPRAMPTPDTTPNPAPFPSPDPTLTSEASSDIEMASLEPERTIKEPLLDAVELTPQKPAAANILEKSCLRVQLQPETKSPNDSVEPMGLIKRIKGVFVRSAGR